MPYTRRTSPLRRTLLASFAIVLLAGCAASSTQKAESTTVGVAETLQFEAPILGDGTLDGPSLAGRAVLLWFWAPT